MYLTVGQVMVSKQCTARTNALVNETVIHSFNHLFSLFHSINNSMCSYLVENKGCLIFPGGSDRKASAYSAGDLGSIPGSGRSPGEGNGNPLQYSCLEKSHGQRSLVGNSPWGCKRIQHDLVTKEQPPFSAPFTEETVLYHYIFLTCHKLTDSICLAFFWALFSVPLTNVSVFMTISY